jgi:hypothetical protein
MRIDLMDSFGFSARLGRAHLLFLVAVLVSGGVPPSLFAQSDNGKTVNVEYQIYSGDKAPQKARELAIRRAQAEAVRRVVGTEVQAERVSSSVQSGEERVERFAQIVRTGASGRVINSEVLEAKTTEQGGSLFYKVRIRATVVPEQGQSDPSFEVNISLNQQDRVYLDRGPLSESDQIVASFEATKDAYLTVLSVRPDTMKVVWPNSRLPEAFVPADSTVEFPPPDLRRLGLRWRVQAPQGQEEVTERIVVVATKKKIPFEPIPNYEVTSGRLKTAGATVEALNRWLVEIPLNQRAVSTATYTVREASEDT